jgi:hypothetical protein
MTQIHDIRLDMVLRFVDVGKRFARIGSEEDGSKEQRPPSRVAVFTIDCATVCSACMHLHRMALWISDCSSSNDIASIVGGALQRIFQLLRD